MIQETLFDYSRKDFPLNIVEENKGLFTDEFAAWIEKNLHVFSAFAEQALYVKKTMRREHYSARTIGEWLRHNSSLREGGGGWKLNNDHFPSIARLVMIAYPELNGLFETRERNQNA